MKALLPLAFSLFFVFIFGCGQSGYGLLGEKCFPDGTCQGELECNLTSNECEFPDKPDNHENVTDSESTDDSTICGSSNCSGCCDEEGKCQIDSNELNCGINGSVCKPCSLKQACFNGICCTLDCTNKCKGEDDGCGGICPTNDCSGCCSATDNKCQTGNDETYCGKNGLDCKDCELGQSCTNGECKGECNPGDIETNPCSCNGEQNRECNLQYSWDEWSSCSDGKCNDHGTYSNGLCICSAGYAGVCCDECASDYAGYPECIKCNCTEKCAGEDNECGGKCTNHCSGCCVDGACEAECTPSGNTFPATATVHKEGSAGSAYPCDAGGCPVKVLASSPTMITKYYHIRIKDSKGNEAYEYESCPIGYQSYGCEYSDWACDVACKYIGWESGSEITDAIKRAAEIDFGIASVDGTCQCKNCVPSCTGKCIGASDGCGGTCSSNQCSKCCDGSNCVSCPEEATVRLCDSRMQIVATPMMYFTGDQSCIVHNIAWCQAITGSYVVGNTYTFDTLCCWSGAQTSGDGCYCSNFGYKLECDCSLSSRNITIQSGVNDLLMCTE